MKISEIKDIKKFFDVVDQCTGKVEVVSPEGDYIVLNSQLSHFVLTALAEKKDTLLDTLEIHCEKPEDLALFIKYTMEGC